MRKIALFAAIFSLAACSSRDKSQARHDLNQAGTAVKKELKRDAAFMKEQAEKARVETQQGVRKLKKELNTDDGRSADRERHTGDEKR